MQKFVELLMLTNFNSFTLNLFKFLPLTHFSCFILQYRPDSLTGDSMGHNGFGVAEVAKSYLSKVTNPMLYEIAPSFIQKISQLMFVRAFSLCSFRLPLMGSLTHSVKV